MPRFFRSPSCLLAPLTPCFQWLNLSYDFPTKRSGIFDELSLTVN
jgi:hypothetical protein